jgi:hypothetical protein
MGKFGGEDEGDDGSSGGGDGNRDACQLDRTAGHLRDSLSDSLARNATHSDAATQGRRALLSPVSGTRGVNTVCVPRASLYCVRYAYVRVTYTEAPLHPTVYVRPTGTSLRVDVRGTSNGQIGFTHTPLETGHCFCCTR